MGFLNVADLIIGPDLMFVIVIFKEIRGSLVGVFGMHFD